MVGPLVLDANVVDSRDGEMAVSAARHGDMFRRVHQLRGHGGDAPTAHDEGGVCLERSGRPRRSWTGSRSVPQRRRAARAGTQGEHESKLRVGCWQRRAGSDQSDFALVFFRSLAAAILPFFFLHRSRPVTQSRPARGPEQGRGEGKRGDGGAAGGSAAVGRRNSVHLLLLVHGTAGERDRRRHHPEL